MELSRGNTCLVDRALGRAVDEAKEPPATGLPRSTMVTGGGGAGWYPIIPRVAVRDYVLIAARQGGAWNFGRLAGWANRSGRSQHAVGFVVSGLSLNRSDRGGSTSAS